MLKAMMQEPMIQEPYLVGLSLEGIIKNVEIPAGLKDVVSEENSDLEFSVYGLLKGVATVSAEMVGRVRRHAVDIGAEAFVNVEGPGYIVVLNYDPIEHRKYTEPLNGETLLVGKNLKNPLKDNVANDFFKLGPKDGAILVMRGGKVHGVKMKLNIGDGDYCGKTGRMSGELPPEAGCRYSAAKDMSKYALGTIAYVLSAHSGRIMRMEGGTLTFVGFSNYLVCLQ
ncbi:MAG: hypothetical protein V1855_01310 [bacterium]